MTYNTDPHNCTHVSLKTIETILHEHRLIHRSHMHAQVCIPSCKPKVFSSNDLVTMGTSAWPGCTAPQRRQPSETTMVRQYGFPQCQGSAPSSAPASTGFVPPPAAQPKVGLLRGVTAAKPPLNNNSPTGVLILHILQHSHMPSELYRASQLSKASI